jgi:hypothetical protein
MAINKGYVAKMKTECTDDSSGVYDNRSEQSKSLRNMCKDSGYQG